MTTANDPGRDVVFKSARSILGELSRRDDAWVKTGYGSDDFATAMN